MGSPLEATNCFVQGASCTNDQKENAFDSHAKDIYIYFFLVSPNWDLGYVVSGRSY